MKKILFGLIAMVVLGLTDSYSQTSKESWNKMMVNYKKSVENILTKECPKNLSLDKFRTSLILGENKLSSYATSEIELLLLLPLKEYGKEFAIKHSLDNSDESSLIFYSSFSPVIEIVDSEIIAAPLGEYRLTWAEVGNCAIAAIGADALYSLAFSGASSWSMAALTSTFTGVAKRFLGPIGVAIAVVSFSLCLADGYAD
jgi:hypothetical protein